MADRLEFFPAVRVGFKTIWPQRRRRDIFVEPGQKRFPSSVGAASSAHPFPKYAAPTGLEIILVLVPTRMSLLTELFCKRASIYCIPI
jgi:hypothetical protein